MSISPTSPTFLEVICPISQMPILQPARTDCGHFFEADQIFTWIATNGANATCPIDRRPLTADDVHLVSIEDMLAAKINAVAQATIAPAVDRQPAQEMAVNRPTPVARQIDQGIPQVAGTCERPSIACSMLPAGQSGRLQIVEDTAAPNHSPAPSTLISSAGSLLSFRERSASATIISTRLERMPSAASPAASNTHTCTQVHRNGGVVAKQQILHKNA